LHGQPVSISKHEVDAAQPGTVLEQCATDRIDTLPNVLAMIKLTAILEEARDEMSVSVFPWGNAHLTKATVLKPGKP